MVILVVFRLVLLSAWSVRVRGAASRDLLSLPATPVGQLFLCAAGDPLQRGLHVRLQTGLPASVHLGGLETEMSEEKLGWLTGCNIIVNCARTINRNVEIINS